MADQSARRDTRPSTPDHELADELHLDLRQVKALIHETRLAIIDLLNERAATTSELAEALGKPKGTVGHHCKVLEEAGLITVVRTKKVRAIEAKYYGRTARLFRIGESWPDAIGPNAGLDLLLEPALAELRTAHAAQWGAEQVAMAAVRYARISQDRAQEWADRLAELADEFIGQERGGDTTYGLLVGLFATERKPLPTADGKGATAGG